jgi:hypothetical protein
MGDHEAVVVGEGIPDQVRGDADQGGQGDPPGSAYQRAGRPGWRRGDGYRQQGCQRAMAGSEQAKQREGKTLASWRAEDSTIPEPTQNSLATLEWVGRAENLVITGASGTGKSHFTEGLAHAAIEKDLKVAWFTLESLTTTITKSKVDDARASWRRKCSPCWARLPGRFLRPGSRSASAAPSHTPQ